MRRARAVQINFSRKLGVLVGAFTCGSKQTNGLINLSGFEKKELDFFVSVDIRAKIKFFTNKTIYKNREKEGSVFVEQKGL